MEEARQHPALTAEQIAFAVIYFGALLAFAIGLAFQFIIHGKSLQIGLLTFLTARAATSFWQAGRPDRVLVRKSSRKVAIANGFILGVFAFAVSLPFWIHL